MTPTRRLRFVNTLMQRSSVEKPVGCTSYPRQITTGGHGKSPLSRTANYHRQWRQITTALYQYVTSFQYLKLVASPAKLWTRGAQMSRRPRLDVIRVDQHRQLHHCVELPLTQTVGGKK